MVLSLNAEVDPLVRTSSNALVEVSDTKYSNLSEKFLPKYTGTGVMLDGTWLRTSEHGKLEILHDTDIVYKKYTADPFMKDFYGEKVWRELVNLQYQFGLGFADCIKSMVKSVLSTTTVKIIVLTKLKI